MGRPSLHNNPLVKLRKDLGLTQSALAKLLGFGREYIARVEAKGKIPPEVKARLEARIPGVEWHDSPKLKPPIPGKPRATKQRTVDSDIPGRPLEKEKHYTLKLDTAKMPLDVRIDATNPSQECIQAAAEMMVKLSNIFTSGTVSRLEIKLTHHLPLPSIRGDLKRKLYACLVKSHENVEAVVTDDDDKWRLEKYTVHLETPANDQLNVAVSNLDCFPKSNVEKAMHLIDSIDSLGAQVAKLKAEIKAL